METAPRLGERLAALDLNYDGIVDLLGTDDILINKVDRHSTATACWYMLAVTRRDGKVAEE
jgi:hypothetical protein